MTRSQVALAVAVALVAAWVSVHRTRPWQFAESVAVGDYGAADRDIADAAVLRDVLNLALPVGLVAVVALISANGAAT